MLVLRAHVATCLACLHDHVPTSLTFLRAHVSCVLTYQRTLGGNLVTHLACLRTESFYSFFFQKKMFICLVLYWDEKLYNKVEVGRVTRNVLRPNLSRTFRHKGSSKIMIFQNHLDFVNS